MTNQILNQIKSGTPFSYKAGYPIDSKRIYTISLNGKGGFILSCNNLKSKQILSQSQVFDIITNQ